MLLNKNIIFAVLKVVRRGDLEHAPFGKHNNINRIEFRPASQYAYFMRFFYCANETESTYRNMTTQRANDAMGEALTRPSFNFNTVIGSGQSRRKRGGWFNSLFVGAFSLSFLSFVLVIASVLFSVFSFSFKPVYTLSA
jgi:hypothetical protein